MAVPQACMIEAEAAQFAYGGGSGPERGAIAVDDLTLHIAKGEFVAVVGRNGSGKSTAARLMTSLLLPDSGVIRIGGIDTRDEGLIWDVRRMAGMVFQDPDSQIVGSTVEEDIAFGPENLGLPPAEIARRVRDALAATGMTEHHDRAPHLLSGGEKQKVALAGVLAMEPECIVLDETTAMLDPTDRDDILALVRRLNRERGLTVVQITHHMDEAAQADRVVVLDAGRVVRDDRPERVFAEAAAIRTRGLDLPQVAELFDLLIQDGFDLPAGVLDGDEALAALLKLHADGAADVHQG